jgi:hypothetical protein
MLLGLIFARGLAAILAAIGLSWAIVTLPSSEPSDTYWRLEDQLLRSEAFSRDALRASLASPTAEQLSDCDTHAQSALLIVELRLAQLDLQSGAVQDFDRHIKALDERATRALSCTPRASLFWLLKFGLDVLHGDVDSHSFKILALSYETSPNEGWIALRRTSLAVPVVLLAPDDLRAKIVVEFGLLIQNGLVLETARAYARAPSAVQALLRPQIELAAPKRQDQFWATVKAAS